ncbi:uncharacterized protein [Mytilus edulis]|uniref:uncharacterized protein n=1 Tax=Mytilus edulis TaxID=6550 RepID=UPI0039EED223
MRRKQYLKIICVCCCVLFLYNLYYANVSPYPQTHYQEENPSTQLTSRPVFLVDTPTCKIPLFSPFEVSIVQFLKPGKKISCNKFLPYTYEDGIILRVNWTAIDQSRHKETFKYCRYQPIIRPYEAEHHNYYDYGDYSEKFDSYIEVSYEFIRVRCFNRANGKLYTNYHQFIYRKKNIEKSKSTAFEKHKAKVSETLNVMMVGVDSISRLNFKRYMRKTNAFLTNRLQAFDMMGYNKVADNTFVNIVPMTLGKFLEDVPWNESLSDIPFDNYNFIWKMFSDRGYRTLYAEDAPKIAIFDYLKAGFHKAPADYFNRHFSIAMTKDKPLWYNEHNCLVNRLETDIILNYTFHFASIMQKNPYFAFTFITGLTHDSTESAAMADEPYFNYLKSLYEKNMLNNTMLILYSDHGMRFGKLRETYIGKLEERLPFLFIVLPEWFRKKYPVISQNLQINERRLITPFDIYETLQNVLFFGTDQREQSSSRGASLFQEVSDERTCSEIGILPHWCTCAKNVPLPPEDIKIRDFGERIITSINEILSTYVDCAHLTLENVLSASKILPYDEVLRFRKSKNDVINRKVTFGDKVNSFVHYQLIVQTSPGNGRFEATIKYDELHDSSKIASDISRINLYGNQSNCVNDHSIKKYCFCNM